MQVNNRPNPIRQQPGGNTSSANKSGSRNVSGQKDGNTAKSTEHKSEEQQQAASGDSSFSDPMTDADTLMRSIIANMAGKAEKKNEQTSAEDKALANVKEQSQSLFADNASNKEAFHELMQKSFGDQYDQGKAEEIRQQSLEGDFSWMPDIKLVDAETLTNTSGPQAGATGLGAYSKEDDTIFLSRDLVMSDPAKAEEILTEEIGHALDARLNVNDAAGDEGNIFSRLSHGDEISTAELTELRSENDSGTIMVEGREVEVEFFIKKLFKKGKDALKKAGKAIKNGIEKVGDTIKKGIDKVKDVVKDHWKAVKKGFKKIMESELLGKIMMVAQFIPIPFVQVAVRVYNIAKAAYGVYQGVKHGSIAMIAGGVAGVAGGAAGLGKALGSTGNWINTATKVANTASAVGAAHKVIAEGNISGAIDLASNYFGSDTKVGNALNTLGKVEDTRQAIKSGNIFSAVSAGTNLMQDFAGDKGDAFLSTINKHSNTIQQIDHARKTGDYSGALNLVRTEFGDALNLPQGTQNTLQRIENGIGFAQNVDQMVNNKDYKGAADLLLGGLSTQVKNPETLERISNFANTLNKIDSAATAVNDGRYADAIGISADVVGLPLSDNTLQFAHSVEGKAKTLETFVGAVKDRDVSGSSAALRELLPASMSEAQQDKIINTFEHAGLAGMGVENIVNAIDNNDYAAAAGSAADLSRHLAGGDNVLSNSMDSFSGLITTAESVDNLIDAKDYKGAADALLNGVSAEVTNPETLARIESLSSTLGQIDTAATAVNEGRYADAIELSASVIGQPLSESAQQFIRGVEHKAQTLEGLVDAVENRDVTASSELLGELLPGALSDAQQGKIVNAFEYAGLAGSQIENLKSAIDNKQFGGAADIAADLSRHLAGKDNVLSNAMDKLSGLLSSKIEVRLADTPIVFTSPTLNEVVGGN